MEDLFLHGLKDLLYAEKKILKALPKLAKGAQSEDVKAAFEKHVRETEGQVERLNQVFQLFGKKPQGKTCPAMDGLAEEGEEVLKEFKGAPALDAGLVAAAQSVEHYEIARYGTLKAWAEQMGQQEAVRLLDQTLQEEIRTDQTLSQIAEGFANQQAQQAAE